MTDDLLIKGGHVLDPGQGLDGTMDIAITGGTGTPYNPLDPSLNVETGGDVYDTAFDEGPFNNFAILDTARPFIGNYSAPVSQVGIYAGDACALAPVGGTNGACGLAPSTLINFSQFNSSGQATITPVQTSQVHYIANGLTADGIFGTPFGNAARNNARDFHTNITNLTIMRTFKFSERVNLQARLDMLNAFNHPNYSSVDPVVDDAGQNGPAFGFGIPQLTGDNPRTMDVGLQINF